MSDSDAVGEPDHSRDEGAAPGRPIVINEAQRRLIMRALTNGMANDRRSTEGGAPSRPTQDEYMRLFSLLSMLKPSLRK
jgi:hypothetical protein